MKRFMSFLLVISLVLVAIAGCTKAGQTKDSQGGSTSDKKQLKGEISFMDVSPRPEREEFFKKNDRGI